MRYVFGFLRVCALAGTLPQSASAQAGEEAVPKVALAINTQHRLPPQLMLRASCYRYLDADADNGAHGLAITEPNAEEPKMRTSGWRSRNLQVKPRGTCVLPRTRD